MQEICGGIHVGAGHDHILGIPGLLETMAFQGRVEPITIVGPVHTERLVESFKAVCYFSRKFDVRAVELKPGDVLTMDGFRVEIIETRHSVPSLGYVLEEDRRLGRFNRDEAVSLGVPPGRSSESCSTARRSR